MSDILTKHEKQKLEATQKALEVLREAQEGGSCEEAIDVARRRFRYWIEKLIELGEG